MASISRVNSSSTVTDSSLSISTVGKGVYQGPTALRKLTQTCDELTNENLAKEDRISELEQALENEKSQSQSLKQDLLRKINTIAEMKQASMSAVNLQKACTETEQLLGEEIKRRKKAVYTQNVLKAQLDQVKEDFSCRNADFEGM